MAYHVVKTIKGRRYLYLQSTYRVGKKVKTKNTYIGPVQRSTVIGGATWEPRSSDIINRALEEARIERDFLRDTLRDHPAKFFLNLRGSLAKQSIGGDSFAELNYQAIKNEKGRGRRHEILKHLDGYLTEYGFADLDDLDRGVEQYLAT